MKFGQKTNRVPPMVFLIKNWKFFSGHVIAHSNGLIELRRLMPFSAHFEAILESYSRLKTQKMAKNRICGSNFFGLGRTTIKLNMIL